jgi:type IV pilus assembly protein PilX
MIRSSPVRARQHGLVLVTTLLLLVVVTILAVGMFRSFGLDEKIAGNMREKQLALQAAESAEYYAEYWLASGNGTSAVTCTSLVAASVGQVCSNILTTVVANVAVVPWQSGGVNVGVYYVPPGMNVTTTETAGSYWSKPVFYISYLGASGGANIYQIDAVGYGGSPNTTAVVESTYMVSTSTKDLGGGQ